MSKSSFKRWRGTPSEQHIQIDPLTGKHEILLTQKPDKWQRDNWQACQSRALFRYQWALAGENVRKLPEWNWYVK